jgi:selenium metabolism protein YedF
MSAKVIIIQSTVLGGGDDQLGELLMASFLRQLSESDGKPKSLVFWNSGVRLVCDGSKVIPSLQKLEDAGVEVLACTTCLEFFDLTGNIKVGKPTTMVKSIQSILSNDVVCL